MGQAGANKNAPAVLLHSFDVSDLGITASFRTAQAKASGTLQNQYPANCFTISLCVV
jgi:hypothetical protein